jgi:hypothetical protein
MNNVNHFLVWLGRKLFPQEPVQKSTLQQTVKRAKQNTGNGRSAAPGDAAADFSAPVSDQMVVEGPANNASPRSKYVREDSGTHENLKIFDENLPDSDDQNGLDPYNTGQFDRSKSWKIRS